MTPEEGDESLISEFDLIALDDLFSSRLKQTMITPSWQNFLMKTNK